MDRRTLMMAAGFTALAPSVAKAADDDLVEFLFVQASPKVSLETGVLRLESANPHTLYFSDRPERIAGVVTTKEFVDHWGTGSDNFKEEPPNAVLVLHSGDTPIVSAVVLRNPRIETESLLYDVEIIGGHKTIEGGWSSLFIDLIGRPLTPLSFAGVARRTRRRIIWG